jgi:uncharacterized protein DUF1553/uncharacterized protein DUF1549
MRGLCLALGVVLVGTAGSPGGIRGHLLDEAVHDACRDKGIAVAPPCSDAAFVRRAFLDAIGTLPAPAETLAFLDDKAPDKRSRLIDALLGRPEYADYWSMKWGDLLRVKSEFPINLWPNAVQAYHRWIHDALSANLPYDEFARQLLTSSGSNFRVPAVNFYRAVQGRRPADLAAAAAVTFMGARFDRMPADRAAGLAAFFSRVAYKPTAEWKEEIVLLDPAPVDETAAMLPDGTVAALKPDVDPRRVFAGWLITPKNPWFARALVNRMWAWLLGRGVVHEPDDLRTDNPPAIPALLTRLEREFVRAGYDLKKLIRLIMTSRTYQASSVPAGRKPDAARYFAHYAPRRLDAEVLIDALCWLTGTKEEYSSPIPEPFTFIPGDHRTILLPDGSITSPFLEMFGRPARDTGYFSERNNDSTDAQRLWLLNSSTMQRKLEGSPRIRQILREARNDPPQIVKALYLLILARPPAPEELDVAAAYYKTPGINPKQATDDVAWALVNSKEFLFRH